MRLIVFRTKDAKFQLRLMGVSLLVVHHVLNRECLNQSREHSSLDAAGLAGLVSCVMEGAALHELCCPVVSSGQPVDGPQFGASPLPWDIPVSLPQRFTDRVEKVRVPHSSIVKVRLVFFYRA